MASTWATGEQHRIRFEDQQVWIAGLGATLRSYIDHHGPLLDGFEADTPITAARGQILMPWPNRIRDGRYDIDGEACQLAITEPERSTALHGLMLWAEWQLAERDRTDSNLTLSHTLYPQPGYPFGITARVTYTLSVTGLRIRMSATNLGDRRCPFGMGAHPYITVGTPSVDDMTLLCPATTHLPPDHQMIPSTELPVTAAYDFTTARKLDDTQLDIAFGGLQRDERGRACIDVHGPDHNRGVRVWMDRSFEYVMVFTADTLPASQRRRSLGIEPMTCAPDAFNNHKGLRWLAPSESFTGHWGIKRLDQPTNRTV